MKILRENLAQALRVAIKDQEKRELAAYYTSDSALLSGWRKALEALEKREWLEISD